MKTFEKQLDEKLAKSEIVPPKTFKITIEEHVTQVFEVEATDIEEAMDIAEEKYAEGEFVIMPQAPTCKQMMAECDENGEATEWVEF